MRVYESIGEALLHVCMPDLPDDENEEIRVAIVDVVEENAALKRRQDEQEERIRRLEEKPCTNGS